MSTGPSFSGSTRRGGGRDRRIAALVAFVALAFLAVAVAKPWAAPATSPPLDTPGAMVPSGAAPSPSLPLVAPSPAPESPGIEPPVTIGTATTGPLPVAFTTPAQPPPSATWTGLRWRRLGPTDPLALVTSITGWQHGFVGVGSAPGSPPTPVWTSSDGVHWDPLLFDTATTFWPGTHVLAVSEVRGGLTAVTEIAEYCTEPCTPTYILPVVAWTSPDGRSWTPHVLPTGWLPSPAGEAPLTAVGPAGILLASTRYGARLAISADGATWTVVAASAFPARFELDALAGTATGYVAAGAWTTGDGRSQAATLWSADGRHWPSVPALLPVAAGGSDGSTATALVDGAGGLVAEGRDMATPGAILWWQSADGRTWRPLLGYPPLGPTTCQGEGCGLEPDGTLVGDGGRLLAMRGVPPVAAWVSGDGRAWRALSMTGDVPDQGPSIVTLLPGGVLVTDLTTTRFGEAITR